MKTLRDLQEFVEATAAPVVVNFDRHGRQWLAKSSRIPNVEFAGESLEIACQRMADYMEQSTTGKQHA